MHAQTLIAQQGVGEPLEQGHKEGDFEQGRYRWTLDVEPWRDPSIVSDNPQPLDPNAAKMYALDLQVQWGDGTPRNRLRIADRCAWSRRPCREASGEQAARLLADRSAARDDAARCGPRARVRHPARRDRDRRARRNHRATQRTHARGRTLPASPHRRCASGAVRPQPGYGHAAAFRRRRHAHALRRRPAGLPRARRAVSARTHAGRTARMASGWK